MTETEFLAILASDSKLWELAGTNVNEDGMTKTLDIPWGIGKIEVTLEGVDNAAGRRAAFSAFGDYVRGLVDDKTSDDAVTAKAEQALARAGSEPDRLPDSGRTGIGRPAPLPDQETMATYDVPATLSADPANRLSELRRAVRGAEDFVAKTLVEIKALEAYVEIINASAHKEAPTGAIPTTPEEEA